MFPAERLPAKHWDRLPLRRLSDELAFISKILGQSNGATINDVMGASSPVLTQA
jgi:hypothetical protein